MRIGIGLPSTIPGVPGPAIARWAVRAEERGFSTLCAVDRLVYENYDPLIALSAAAAVTERIGLTTAVILAPLRANHAEFAKQVASLDQVSAGRFVLGMAVGSREDDYLAGALDFHRRGREFDELLARLRSIWTDEAIGIGPRPHTAGGPELLIGGVSDAAYRRIGTYGAGWVSGTGGPEAFATGAARARDAWAANGREGRPRTVTLSFFALGAGAREAADRCLLGYYRYRGAVAEQIAASALVTPDEIAARIAAFAAVGCDEMIILPTSPDLAQVDLLADVVGL